MNRNTKEVGFLALDTSEDQYISSLNKSLTTKYIGSATIYPSYSDWQNDIKKADNFDLDNIKILPVKVELA